MKSQDDKPADAPDVRALTLAVRRGNADAFSRFYDLYGFRIYKYLLVLSGGDENEAREVGQAVMIKLAKRFKVFDDERMLWAWLCTLAKNTFIDHCRASQRRNRLVTLDGIPFGAPSHNSADLIAEILRDALARLSPDERELIEAAYVDKRPLQELADSSGQTYKAVESRLARLRRKLKEQLLRDLRHERKS